MSKVLLLRGATLSVLGLLVFAGAGQVAPAPAPAPAQDESLLKLEKLKKKLPDLLTEWKQSKRLHTNNDYDFTCEPRLVRRLSPTEAKVAIVIQPFRMRDARRDPSNEQILTIYLQFFDGVWTTTKFEAVWNGYFCGEREGNSFARFLMLAIDESAEK